MAKKFECIYAEIVNKMMEQLKLTQETVYPSFVSVCRTLFDECVNWDRIVCLYSFSGQLAVYCASNGQCLFQLSTSDMDDSIINIAQWLYIYTSTELASWMEQNGDWEGFCQLYESSEWSLHRQCLLLWSVLV